MAKNEEKMRFRNFLKKKKKRLSPTWHLTARIDGVRELVNDFPGYFLDGMAKSLALSEMRQFAAGIKGNPMLEGRLERQGKGKKDQQKVPNPVYIVSAVRSDLLCLFNPNAALKRIQ